MCTAITWEFWKNADSDSVGLGQGLGFCVSLRLLGHADAAGPQTTLGILKFWNIMQVARWMWFLYNPVINCFGTYFRFSKIVGLLFNGHDTLEINCFSWPLPSSCSSINRGTWTRGSLKSLPDLTVCDFKHACQERVMVAFAFSFYINIIK